MWSLLFGGCGLFPEEAEELVDKILSPSESETKEILDIGYGSGSWQVAPILLEGTI